MTGLPYPVNTPMIAGCDLAAGPDQTVETMYVPHAHHPGCRYTVLSDEQLVLFNLGLLPLRCKSCGELLTDREGA